MPSFVISSENKLSPSCFLRSLPVLKPLHAAVQVTVENAILLLVERNVGSLPEVCVALVLTLEGKFLPRPVHSVEADIVGGAVVAVSRLAQLVREEEILQVRLASLREPPRGVDQVPCSVQADVIPRVRIRAVLEREAVRLPGPR